MKTDFDFSSIRGWEDFHRHHHQKEEENQIREKEHNQAYDDTKLNDQQPTHKIKESIMTEWHSSLSLDRISDMIPRDAQNIVIIGCGDSRLPTVIVNHKKKQQQQLQQLQLDQQSQEQVTMQHQQQNEHQQHGSASLATTTITLVDSSPTCIAMLKKRYEHSKEIICLCADVTKISEQLPTSTADVILDKGLMDALLCGEGWDGPVTALLSESYKVLKPGGLYLLISYQLPVSTREFIEQNCQGGTMEWTFDVLKEEANRRRSITTGNKVFGGGGVSVSFGMKKQQL